jgi:peptide/nickel transport system permease protein
VGRGWGDLAVFIGKRLAQLVPVLLGVIVLTFIFTHVSPNPCGIWVPKGTKSAVAACIQYFGLNQPLDVQFWKYLTAFVQGNWGVDPTNGYAPVLPAILAAVPKTVELVLAAVVLMVIIGIPLGVVAAVSNGRWADHLVRIFYLSGWATPTYLGAVLIAVFVGPVLNLPTKGDFTGTPNFPQPTHMLVLDALLAGNLSGFANAASHLILPAAALAFLNMGIATRMTRSSMLEVLPLDFVKTARMKGLSEFKVVYKHALRNGLITTITVLGLTGGTLLSGTVVIEDIFAWPGIGNYAFTAITNYVFAGVIAVVIVFAIAVVVANLLADILYGILDPRVDWR